MIRKSILFLLSGMLFVGFTQCKKDPNVEEKMDVYLKDWFNFSGDEWEYIDTIGEDDFVEPDDIDNLGINQFYYVEEDESVIVYVRYKDNISRLLNAKLNITSPEEGDSTSGWIEVRSYGNSGPNYLTLVVALVEGQWDREGYVRNEILPNLNFQIVKFKKSKLKGYTQNTAHHLKQVEVQR